MRKSDATKNRILQSAYALISKQSYDQVKITEICREAGVSASTFYLYFPTKDRLILEYYDQYMVFDQQDFSEILQEPNAWSQLWRAHVLYCEKMENIGREYCQQMYRISNGFQHINQVNRSILQPLMVKAQQAGMIRNQTEPNALYDCTCYLMRGLYFTWSSEEKDYCLIKEIRKTLEVVYDLPEEMREETRVILHQ